MRTFALCLDGSEQARDFALALQAEGIETVEMVGVERLAGALHDGLSAVVLVSPHKNLPRMARVVLDKAGGLVSRIPLVVALVDQESRPEPEILKHADDFVVGPGGASELVARLEVLMLKRGGPGNIIDCGELTINLDAHQVFLEGRPVDFTYKEFELLKMMASTPGRAYSRDELLRNVWGYDYFGGTRTVDVHVRRLRSKIEGSRQYIETVHGVGYRFIL